MRHNFTPAFPTESRRGPNDELKSASPVKLVFDLAEGGTVFPRFDRPHVPVLAAFGGDRLHQYGMKGVWDLGRAASENPEALLRSVRQLSPEEELKEWDDLTFRFGPHSFLFADDSRIVGYAKTPQEAERLVARFNETYRKPLSPTGGSFHLITTGREISTETVTLGYQTILDDETFALHYGEEALRWHQDFIERVCASNHGLSIFEGTPGTGKTSYLRHLLGVLKKSHRFYFIPPASMAVLSSPDFIGFWANERRRHTDRNFVVILEDSDAALMTRGADNREQVSAILNLSDGMLADFLRLHVICTINCCAADIDQALLRPGRLLCHRVFPRLNHTEASRLARSLGKLLPVVRDYSLAEVFADNDSDEINRPQIGFAA